MLDERSLDRIEVKGFLDRHVSGDWGDLCGGDKTANEEALLYGSRIFSAYRSKAGTKFWVITEAVNEIGQRESTCVLLPDEY